MQTRRKRANPTVDKNCVNKSSRISEVQVPYEDGDVLSHLYPECTENQNLAQMIIQERSGLEGDEENIFKTGTIRNVFTKQFNDFILSKPGKQELLNSLSNCENIYMLITTKLDSQDENLVDKVIIVPRQIEALCNRIKPGASRNFAKHISFEDLKEQHLNATGLYGDLIKIFDYLQNVGAITDEMRTDLQSNYSLFLPGIMLIYRAIDSIYLILLPTPEGYQKTNVLVTQFLCTMARVCDEMIAFADSESYINFCFDSTKCYNNEEKGFAEFYEISNEYKQKDDVVLMTPQIFQPAQSFISQMKGILECFGSPLNSYNCGGFVVAKRMKMSQTLNTIPVHFSCKVYDFTSKVDKLLMDHSLVIDFHDNFYLIYASSLVALLPMLVTYKSKIDSLSEKKSDWQEKLVKQDKTRQSEIIQYNIEGIKYLLFRMMMNRMIIDASSTPMKQLMQQVHQKFLNENNANNENIISKFPRYILESLNNMIIDLNNIEY